MLLLSNDVVNQTIPLILCAEEDVEGNHGATIGKLDDELLFYLDPGIVWFLGKTFAVVWLLMWVRWTFPRLRVDQILKLEWKYLMPLCLINLILMTVVVAFGWHF